MVADSTGECRPRGSARPGHRRRPWRRHHRRRREMIVTDRFVACAPGAPRTRRSRRFRADFDLPPDADTTACCDRADHVATAVLLRSVRVDRAGSTHPPCDGKRVVQAAVVSRGRRFRPTLKRREDSDLGLRFAAGGCAIWTQQRTHSRTCRARRITRPVAPRRRQYGVAAVDIDRRHPGVCSPWTVLDQLPARGPCVDQCVRVQAAPPVDVGDDVGDPCPSLRGIPVRFIGETAVRRRIRMQLV